MGSKKILYILLALVVIGGGAFFFLNDNDSQEENNGNLQENSQPSVENEEEEMVNCGQTDDPMCFVNRMNGCLPVTAEMVGSDGETTIKITILGVEDGKCHFQRELNGVMDMNCYFPKGTMNMDTLDQTFGNDKGLQQVVDDACQSGW